MLPKSVTVSKYLLTVTLFPCPEGVTVTEDVCIVGDRVQAAAGEAARHPGDVVAAATGKQFNRHFGLFAHF